MLYINPVSAFEMEERTENGQTPANGSRYRYVETILVEYDRNCTEWESQ
jgi:hypothetical protein